MPAGPLGGRLGNCRVSGRGSEQWRDRSWIPIRGRSEAFALRSPEYANRCHFLGPKSGTGAQSITLSG